MHEAGYLHLLKEAYLERKKRNTRYSLRAFARQLDLSPSYVSLLFRGKRHLNPETASETARRLGWNGRQQKYFLSLLRYETALTDSDRELALRQLTRMKNSNLQFSTLEHDVFTLVSNWHYNAILSLLTLKNVRPSTGFIARRLGLEPEAAQAALERLLRLNLVRHERGLWYATSNHLQVKSTPSAAIRRHHQEVLAKAGAALEQQSFDERDFSATTLTVDPARLPEVKKRILEFHKEMALLLEGDSPSEVYQLSLQLFRLTRPARDPKEELC